MVDISLFRTSTCLRLACATVTEAASALAACSRALDIRLRDIHGSVLRDRILSGNFSFVKEALHPDKILLIASQLRARLVQLGITGCDPTPGPRLIDRSVGLFVGPRIVVVRCVDLLFEAGDVRFRRGKASLLVLWDRVPRSRSPFFTSEIFIDREFDEAAGHLRAYSG